MFFMIQTLCSISVITRVFIMFGFVLFFFYNTFSNTLSISLLCCFVYTFSATVSIGVFYAFNKMFRQTLKGLFRLGNGLNETVCSSRDVMPLRARPVEKTLINETSSHQV